MGDSASSKRREERRAAVARDSARSGFGIGPERKLLILILAKAKSGRQEARQGISVED